MAKIIPGILTNNEEEYHDWLLTAEKVSDLIQIDVIDGKFANNTTIGVETIKKYHSSSNLEVQLMVIYPQNYIDDLVRLEYVSRIIIPFEVHGGLEESIIHIKNHNVEVGLSINPSTPVPAVFHWLDEIDLLCIFSAEPGFSGKKLEEATYSRIKQSKKYKADLPVEIDIGVNFETAPKLAKAGADFLIATSALKNAPNYEEAYTKLAQLART